MQKAFLDKVTLTITNLSDGAAEILAATAFGGIMAGDISYAAGVLTIDPAGTADVVDFLTVLQSVTYDNTSGTPTVGDRTINVVANDGIGDGNTAVATVAVTSGPSLESGCQ